MSQIHKTINPSAPFWLSNSHQSKLKSMQIETFLQIPGRCPEKFWLPRPCKCTRPGWMGLWAT